MSEIVIYEDGTVELPVSFEKENFWLSQADLVSLYERDQSVISRHINKVFKDNEIDKKSNMQKMHISNIYKIEKLDKDSSCSILEQVAKDGNKRKINFYNLDKIIAPGYSFSMNHKRLHVIVENTRGNINANQK